MEIKLLLEKNIYIQHMKIELPVQKIHKIIDPV